jgi:hypothetical protein
MAFALEPLTRRHSPTPPPRLRPSRATPMAAWRAPRPAPCNHRPRYRLANAALARASRRRAPRAAAHERRLYRLRPPLRPCACAIGCSHATGFRLDGSTVLAFGGALRIHTNAVHFVGVVWQRLGGFGGGAPAHAQRHSPAQQTVDRQLRRRACGVGRAIDGVFAKAGRKQTYKRTNEQAYEQTNIRQQIHETAWNRTDRLSNTHCPSNG